MIEAEHFERGINESSRIVLAVFQARLLLWAIAEEYQHFEPS